MPRPTAALATRGQNTTGPFEVPGTYVVHFRLATAADRDLVADLMAQRCHE
ncbi:MAG: hypothetical protein J0I06_05745 [Planctomycetes bacterium]|nr:hypothetical protein [Planctomycetota bacterium]